MKIAWEDVVLAVDSAQWPQRVCTVREEHDGNCVTHTRAFLSLYIHFPTSVFGVLGRIGILVCMENSMLFDAHDDNNMVWVEKADTSGFTSVGDTNRLDCNFVWAVYYGNSIIQSFC